MLSDVSRSEMPICSPLAPRAVRLAGVGVREQPQSLVFGGETANQAHQRFSRAIASAIETHHGQNVAVVSHGTVMTLFVARAAGLEPFHFWKRLDMPAFAVLSIPGFGLVTVVETVEDAQSENLE